MKKFPLDLFLIGELVSVVLAVKEGPYLADIFGMFLILQILVLSVPILMWLDRLTGR